MCADDDSYLLPRDAAASHWSRSTVQLPRLK